MGEFSKKRVVVKKIFFYFLFFWVKKHLKKKKKGDEKGGMNEKEGEAEKNIISGHLFLNKEDKKTAKSDLQNFFFCS